MGWKWKKLIGGAAPAIATALGVGGGPASIAVTALSRALLGHDKGSEDDVAEAIAAGATPEQVEKIQVAEREFTLKLIDGVVQLERIEADDRANARKREVDTHDWTPRVIGIAVMVCFFALLAIMVRWQIPADNQRPFDILLGMLGGSVTTVLTYYFGSSSSGRAKDAVIGRIAGTK